MIFVSSFAAAKAGPRLRLMNVACCCAGMNMLGLLPGCSGSFWTVMASSRIFLYRTYDTAYS